MRAITGKVLRGCLVGVGVWSAVSLGAPDPFVDKHCVECHDHGTRKGGLDLERLSEATWDTDTVATWIKVFDRVERGEMPPKKKGRVDEAEKAAYLGGLGERVLKAEREVLGAADHRALRRLTRSEYENTVRDLFEMPGVLLQNILPSDGSAHGFDKNADALDISHVNLAKYVEAADHVLNLAIATRPEAPPVEKVRLSLAGNYQANIMLMGGDAMCISACGSGVSRAFGVV